jgi:hypothetical protein
MKLSKDALAGLSREEKLRALALIEEKRRREKERRPLFADRAHKEQLEVLACEEIERYVFAGNGSGKTALGAEDTRCHVTGDNPYTKKNSIVPCRAFIVLDKPEKMETVIIPELRKWMNLREDQLHKKGKPYISLITLDNGSTIRPIFWDQDPMTAEGIEGDYFWFDEPPPRNLYIALRRAGRTKGRRARYLITGTPLAAPWLRTDVFEPWSKGERPNTMCFRFHTEMNKHNLADGYIDEFSAVLSEKERGIRLRGEFFDLDGLALSHLFRRDTHTIPRDKLNWSEEYPCVVVIDPHPSKAHHAVLLGADRDNRLYVLDEYKEKAITRKFTLSLIERGWFTNYSVQDIVFDSLGSAETTSGEGFKPFGVVMNEVLKQHNIGRARATTYNEKDDEDFVERIRDALAIPDAPDNFGRRVPKLRFVADCKGTISDVENVQWKRDKSSDTNKPALDISNKDFLSCVKYGLATNLYANKRKEKAYYRARPAYGVHGKISMSRRPRQRTPE